MQLSEFIEQTNRQDSPGAILALMERAAGDLGFDRYAYCALTCHERYTATDNPPPAVAHNFPDDWIDYYFAHDYPSKDPVVVYAPALEGPFLWRSLDTRFELDRAQRTLMQQAREAKLRNGVGVSLHAPRGDVFLVTFAAGDGHPDAAAEMSKLRLLAVQFHAAYSCVGRTGDDAQSAVVLSPRERECLQWLALGKTPWDIGMTLSISEHTVNFHVRNLYRKLEASNRTMAVVKAIRFGLISTGYTPT